LGVAAYQPPRYFGFRVRYIPTGQALHIVNAANAVGSLTFYFQLFSIEIRIFYRKDLSLLEQKKLIMEDKLQAIRLIIDSHTAKLNIMKDNRARWEEEGWTDSEMRESEIAINTLAAILSDLNRALKN